MAVVVVVSPLPEANAWTTHLTFYSSHSTQLRGLSSTLCFTNPPIHCAPLRSTPPQNSLLSHSLYAIPLMPAICLSISIAFALEPYHRLPYQHSIILSPQHVLPPRSVSISLMFAIGLNISIAFALEPDRRLQSHSNWKHNGRCVLSEEAPRRRLDHVGAPCSCGVDKASWCTHRVASRWVSRPWRWPIHGPSQATQASLQRVAELGALRADRRH